MFGSDSAKRKRSDGSRLTSVETHEQAGPSMSPQSVREPSPLKDQGRPPAHPSKKPRHITSLDPDTEMSNTRAEPPPWTHTYDHPPSNTNPIGSPELMSPARSPDAGSGMDLDVSAKEEESVPHPPLRQHKHLPPPLPQLQQRVSTPPQQTQQYQAESPPRLRAAPTLPTGSGSHMWTEEDRNLIEKLRSQMSKEPGYNEFLESRNGQHTMREQLKQYTYITNQLEEHTRGGSNIKKVCMGSSTPRESCSLYLVVDARDGRFQLT